MSNNRSWLDASPIGREDFLQSSAQLTDDDRAAVDLWIEAWDAFERECLAAAVAQATCEGRVFDYAEYQQHWRKQALIELGNRHRAILAPVLLATREAYGRAT